MKIYYNYFVLQLKRSFIMLMKSLCGIFVMGIVMIGMIIFFSYMLLQSRVMPKMQIGVCIPDSESISLLGAKYISSVDSVKSLCDFCYMDKETALLELQNGNLQVVIALPEGFYHDVNIGLNPPAQLYLSNENTDRRELFMTLVESGVSYLQIAESGVYAALDSSHIYELSIDSGDLGDYIALAYAKEIAGRDSIFAPSFVSPFGEAEMLQYYYATGMVLLLLVFSLNFCYLYDQNSKTLGEQLAIRGLRGIRIQIIRILVETVVLFAIGCLIYTISLVVSFLTGSYFLVFNIAFIFILLFVSLGIATGINALFTIMGMEKNGYGRRWGVFLMVILLALLCGLFFPISYISPKIAWVSYLLPLRYYANILGYGLYEQSSMMEINVRSVISGYSISILMITVWIFITIGIGALASWKRSDNI